MTNGPLRRVVFILAILLASVAGLVGHATAAGETTGTQDAAPKTETSKPVADTTTTQTAQAPSAPKDSNVFTLGEIEVKDNREVNRYVTSDKVGSQEMLEFGTNRLPEALDLLPGVTIANSGGRFEKSVYVRGFSTARVPVFMDGIPIYVPYDRTFDFSRFSTFDLSEIVVTKGFTSVLYGPNTMGGAINMVTRRPVKKFEGNAGAGYGSGNNYYGYANLGSKQEKWYVQGGLSYMNQTYFPVADSFTSTRNQAGLGRTHSDTQDSRVSLKIGFTPAQGHEYVLGWIKQTGAKGGPPDARNSNEWNYNQNRWLWPRWDKDSYYFTSLTPLGEKSYAKARLFYDKFENWLDYFTPNNNSYAQYYNSFGQRSYYDDYTYGGSFELGTKLIPYNDIKASFHYKRDSHRERVAAFNIAHNAPANYVLPPWTPDDDVTMSVGLQDTIDFTKNFYAIAGISYDRLDALRANKWVNVTPRGGIPYVGWQYFNTDSVGHVNPQLGLFYRTSDTGIVHATAEQKTRFPTQKERYSWGFGRSLDNPDLKPEQSINYELGYEDVFFKKIRFKTAIFRNDISDAIQQVLVLNPYYGQPGWTTPTVNQNQNIGRVQQYGLELQGDISITENLDGGGNYTYLNRQNMKSSGPYIRLIDVPAHKVFTYMKYKTPLRGLSLLGSFEYLSSRTTSSDGVLESGPAAIANFKMMYEPIKDWILEGGVNNLFDRYYKYATGYHESGRTLFAGFRCRF